MSGPVRTSPTLAGVFRGLSGQVRTVWTRSVAPLPREWGNSGQVGEGVTGCCDATACGRRQLLRLGGRVCREAVWFVWMVAPGSKDQQQSRVLVRVDCMALAGFDVDD